MKTLALFATLTLATSAYATEPPPAAGGVCLPEEYAVCVMACNDHTPGNCVLVNTVCTFDIPTQTPTCGCDVVCTISPHLPPGNGGFKHFEVRWDDELQP